MRPFSETIATHRPVFAASRGDADADPLLPARLGREGPRIVVHRLADSSTPSLPVQGRHAGPASDEALFHEPSERPPGFGVRQSSGACQCGWVSGKAAEDRRSPRRYRAGSSSTGRLERGISNTCCDGFTLIELLVVIGIIGILVSIGLPAMRGFGQSSTIQAANRQMLDDLWLARAVAIKDRTTVYMVFVPPTVTTVSLNAVPPRQRLLLSNLYHGQFTTYALLAARSVGDQPGQGRVHYLTRWKTLPEGMLIWTNKFQVLSPLQFLTITNAAVRPFAYAVPPLLRGLPFPTTGGTNVALPYIAFNSQGQLTSMRDEVIPLARGSVFFAPNNNAADVVETPRGNHTNDLIAINWLTGRAAAVQPQFR